MSDADAEAAETMVWLDFALEFGYLTQQENAGLIETYNQICAQLTVMMAKPQDWTLKVEAKN